MSDAHMWTADTRPRPGVAEQIIHHAYIDWVNTGPDDLAKHDVTDVGEFIGRRLARAGYRIVRGDTEVSDG